mmetsp:Transcript_65300/g.181581  ORF Transcript_65300/g.181581 Transcript_65300/m.181581 type:complete len:487 (-) Transcript_65300:174-1634(-)
MVQEAWRLKHQSFPDLLHHRHKLLEINDSVVISVDLGHQLLDGRRAHDFGNVAVTEDLLELVLRDLSIAVAVKGLERRPDNVVLQVQPLVQGGGQELGVIDDATTIGVDFLHDLLEVTRNLFESSLRNALLHLVHGELPIAVAVQVHEDLAQRLDLVLVQLLGDNVERGLLELVLRPEAPEVVHEAVLQRCVVRLGRFVPDPDVVQGLLRCVTVAGVHLQEHANEILCVLRNVLPVRRVEGEVPQPHLGKHLRIRLAEERRISAHEHVHDDAAAPQVAEVVVLSGKHLRRDVVRRARLRREHLIGLEGTGQAEVDNLEVGLLYRIRRHEDEILGLQVAVAHVVLMHVINCADDLLHDNRRLHLCEVTRLDDAVEKFSTCAKLHDEINVFPVLEGFVKLDNVGMVHHLHDGNLLLEAFDVLHVVLGNRLHSAACPGGLVFRLDHRAIRPLSDFLPIKLIEVLQLPRVFNDEVLIAEATFGDLLFRKV